MGFNLPDPNQAGINEELGGSGGGGGSVPTGTGFRHITAGVEDAASALVANNDVQVGAAIVEAKLALNFATHSNANDPSSGEKSALAGTDGTPGIGNKYVTDSDARNANNRNPNSHASTHANGGSDSVKLDDLAVPDDNTDLDVLSTRHGLTPKLSGSSATFLSGVGTFLVPSVGVHTDYRHSGTVGYEAWYGTPLNASAPGTLSLSKDNMYCCAFYVSKTMTVDRIAIFQSGHAGGGNYHLGVYADTGNIYPGSLLFDVGVIAFAGADAAKPQVISYQFLPGLYWPCILAQNNSNSIYGLGTAAINSIHPLGYTAAFLPSMGNFKIPQAYGALPGSAPGGTTPETATGSPLILFRIATYP